MIRRHQLLGILLIGMAWVLLPGNQPLPAQEKEKGAIDFALNGDVLSINGTSFSLPVKRAAVEKVLGKATRESRLANNILTWDDLGIIAYMRPGDDKVFLVSLTFGKETFEFWPKKQFSGKATIDGAALKADTTVKAINREKKGLPFLKDTVLPGYWLIRYKSLEINLKTPVDRETPLIELAIESVAK